MRNYIFQKTTITNFAFILFSVTVIAAISFFLAAVSTANGTRFRRQISGRTPEIVLTAINEHIDGQEEKLNQHIQQSQDLLDQHIEQAEISWDETLDQSIEKIDELIPAN